MKRVSDSAADTRTDQRNDETKGRGAGSAAGTAGNRKINLSPACTFHSHHRRPPRGTTTGPRTHHHIHRRAEPRTATPAPLWTLHHTAPARPAMPRPAAPALAAMQAGRLARKARAALQWVRTTTFKTTARRFFFTTAEPSRQPLNEFRKASRQLKKRKRIDAAINRIMQAAPPTPAQQHAPPRPLRMGLAELWAWYKATGKSYAQFKRDHGVN